MKTIDISVKARMLPASESVEVISDSSVAFPQPFERLRDSVK